MKTTKSKHFIGVLSARTDFFLSVRKKLINRKEKKSREFNVNGLRGKYISTMVFWIVPEMYTILHRIGHGISQNQDNARNIIRNRLKIRLKSDQNHARNTTDFVQKYRKKRPKACMTCMIRARFIQDPGQNLSRARTNSCQFRARSAPIFPYGQKKDVFLGISQNLKYIKRYIKQPLIFYEYLMKALEVFSLSLCLFLHCSFL